MATEKKELTPTQKQKRYFLLQWATYFGQFFALITPFFVMGIVNYDKYFVEYSGTKMSIAFFLAIGVMGFTVWGITKKKLENSYITFIIKYILWAFIFTMLGEIIRDTAAIMWFGLIGIFAAFGLDETSKYYAKKKAKVVEAKQEADKEELVEQVKEERAEKKIKVRIRK